MSKFYAATNNFASSTSMGFANAWVVRVFGSKESRDEFVASADDMATRAITKAQIKNYIDPPKPFSGQRRALDFNYFDGAPAGHLGFVELMYPWEGIDL